MKQLKCSCAQFDQLEGASVSAYIKAFLEGDAGVRGIDAGVANREERNRYRCRICGSIWEKRAPLIKGEGTRPSLVRLSGER